MLEVKKAHFFTGKGGVGKSLLAATYAYQLSLKKQQILLCELADISFYKDFFQLEDIHFESRSLTELKSDSLFISQYRGFDCLRDYTKHLLKIETLAKIFFENPISKSLMQVAPGLQELAILGKITSSPRKHGPPMNFDQIVVDSYSSGHFLSLLRAPKALAQTISVGPMGEQSRGIDRWLRDPKFTHIHLVTLAEELPITETIELYYDLKKEFGLTSIVYLNKLSGLKESELDSLSEASKNHFLKLIKLEEWSRKELQKNKINFLEIPFVLETNPTELVFKLAKTKLSSFVDGEVSD